MILCKANVWYVIVNVTYKYVCKAFKTIAVSSNYLFLHRLGACTIRDCSPSETECKLTYTSESATPDSKLEKTVHVNREYFDPRWAMF